MQNIFKGEHFTDAAREAKFKPHPILQLVMFVLVFYVGQILMSIPLFPIIFMRDFMGQTVIDEGWYMALHSVPRGDYNSILPLYRAQKPWEHGSDQAQLRERLRDRSGDRSG